MEAPVTQPLDQFSAHDLIQPITALKLQADLLARRLREGKIAPSDVLTGLESISARAGALAEHLAASLTTESEGAYQLELRPVSCDLLEVVQDVCRSLDDEDGRRVVIRAEEPVRGVWDRERLAQVVRNLIENGLKYSSADARVEVEIRERDREAELVVSDHGIGLDASELSDIFIRSFRSPRAVESGARGMGIGLYGCRLLVEAHGGRIWAVSDGEGRGSSFYVAIPVSRPD